jgi:hypothetical protein
MLRNKCVAFTQEDLLFKILHGAQRKIKRPYLSRSPNLFNLQLETIFFEVTEIRAKPGQFQSHSAKFLLVF